jgi:hypothetical protein
MAGPRFQAAGRVSAGARQARAVHDRKRARGERREPAERLDGCPSKRKRAGNAISLRKRP